MMTQSTPQPALRSDRRLRIAMPGIPAWQEKFWNEVIIPLGLEPFADRVYQANAFTDDHLPNQAIKRWGDQITQVQLEHTAARLDGEWDGPDFARVYGDYEPDGWQYAKQQHGYDGLDLHVLGMIRDGIRQACPGLPYALYNAPMFPHNRAWDDHLAINAAMTYKPQADGDDWIWQGLYPGSSPLHNDLHDPRVESGLAKRVITGNKIKRVFLRPGQPVIGALFFRHFQDNVAYQRRTLHLYNATGGDELIAWVKCGERERDGTISDRLSRVMLDEYKRQWSASADDLLRWLTRQPVETDAGGPQGVD